MDIDLTYHITSAYKYQLQTQIVRYKVTVTHDEKIIGLALFIPTVVARTNDIYQLWSTDMKDNMSFFRKYNKCPSRNLKLQILTLSITMMIMIILFFLPLIVLILLFTEIQRYLKEI